jgi:hypothetical protein
MDRRDAGVLKLASDPCLGDEPAADRGVWLVAILENLDGDLSVEDGVDRPEHHTHPAAREFVAEAIAATG